MRTYEVNCIEDGMIAVEYVDADTFSICSEGDVRYVVFDEFPPDDDGEVVPVAMFPYEKIIFIRRLLENNKKETENEN